MAQAVDRLCNEQRKAARSEFESDLAKLQANGTLVKPANRSEIG